MKKVSKYPDFPFQPGDEVRLPGWECCVLHITGIGRLFIWGALFDIRSQEMIDYQAFYRKKQNWIEVLTVEQMLRKKKLKRA